MTNERKYAPVEYGCNGETVDFSFPWKILKKEDLIVQVKNELGEVSTLTLGVDYQVVFVAMGGNVTTLNTYDEGCSIIISRNVGNFQSTSYSTSPGFQASEIEKSFDKFSCAIQEIDYKVDEFKEDFSEEVNQNIDDFKNETNTNIDEFKYEVNSTIDEVNTAAKLINTTIEKVDNAVEETQEQASIATEQATIATEKTQEVSETYNLAINDILNTSSQEQTTLQEIKQEALEVKDELVQGNMFKYQLFDTVLKDHVLSYKESKGFALQGTYVYKEAIAGSRYGYPDFYNKCLEEYQNGETEYFPIRGELWEQPILSENGTLGGDTFAVETDSVYSDDGENYEPYRMFDGDASTSWQSNGTTSSATYFTFYNPKPINVTQITWSGTPIYGTITAGVVYGSNDNSEWVQIGTFSGGTTTGGTMDLSANKEFYKYHKITPTSWTDSSSTYTNGWAELTITAYHPAIKINSNGHRFYDIAHKDAVDEYYNANGAAWFYGIDTENERIFLPRNDWFFQSGNAENVGQFNEAGLPNITGQFPISCNYGTPTGPFRLGSTFSGNGSSANGCRYITYDQSRVNTIYGNSDTVQPKSVNLLLYIVVGNTNVESSITDVVDVTTTENDTTPLFTAQYFDFKPNNASWLKAGEQTNGAGIYKFCFSELVKELSEPKYGLKVIETANMIAGVDYSLYWQVDQVNMTFKTPTAIATKSLSGAVCGNGMTVGWTNGSEFAGTVLDGTGGSGNTGAVRLSPGSYGRAVGAGSAGGIAGLGECYGITTDPSNSGIIAEQSSAQLYFKVANAVEKLELLDAGKVMEEAVLKSNLVEAQFVIKTYQVGTSGYRIWSDGYCEQWGNVVGGSGTSGTIVFLKKFKDTNYIVVNNLSNSAANNYFAIQTEAKTTSSVSWYKSHTGIGGDWVARGYLAKGEY